MAAFLLVMGWYLADRCAYAKSQPYFSVENSLPDTTLTIGIIGDSWASDHRLDTLLNKELALYGLDAQIISSGQGGAKTRIIYENLFKDPAKPNSSKFIIEKRPDYIIVIAGVNDAIGQMGKAYYTQHMMLLVNTILHYNITPIVVTLPEFDVVSTNNEFNWVKRYRNVLFSYFNNHGELYNIRSYREHFAKELAKGPFAKKVILVNFEEVCGDAKKCRELYLNPSHLSRKGNQKLAQVIARVLGQHINLL